MSGFGLDNHPSVPPIIPIKVWPKQRSWSYSAVTQHNKCPLAFRFRRIDRLPEPEGEALTRGKDTHAVMAEYLTTGVFLPDAPPKLVVSWVQMLNDLRARNAVPEQQIAFDKDWNRLDVWYGDNVWARIVMDAVVVTEDYVEVTEWKTGRVYPEHMQQLRLYALAGLMAYPTANMVVARVVYLDTPEVPVAHHSALRNAVPLLRAEFGQFAHKLLNDDLYPAKPGRGCNWCHFRRSNGGPCDHG
jgi:RecB family exonuclease